MNDQEAASKLYPPGPGLQRASKALEDEQAVVLGLPEAARNARYAEFDGLQRDTGMPPTVTKRLMDLDHRVEVAAARKRTDDVDHQAEAEARRSEVRALYGAKEGEALIARFQKYVQQHATLRELLADPRIGNDRDVVHGLIEHVRDINYR